MGAMTSTTMDGTPLLSVVLGTCDRLEQLRECIESVVAETRTPFILYVTDAGSTDGTIEYLQSIASDRIRPIFVGRKLGQARAYNDVFAMVTTPYVCWISDDNIVVANGLDRAVAILERQPSVGMVGLKVKDIRGPFVDAPYIGGLSSVGILNVNQGVLRTQILKDVGGFSEEFRDYGIDPDLTAKVLLKGWDIAYTKAVALHHQRNWETDPASPAYKRLMERQKAYKELYEKRYGSLFRPSPLYLAKRGAWKLFRQAMGRRFRLDSTRPFLGLIARDWHNIMGGRYISLLDGWRTRGEDFHLVQRGRR